MMTHSRPKGKNTGVRLFDLLITARTNNAGGLQISALGPPKSIPRDTIEEAHRPWILPRDQSSRW